VEDEQQNKRNGGQQQRRKMEELKKLGKMSRQKLETESAGFVSCHAGHMHGNGGTGINLTLYLIHKL